MGEPLEEILQKLREAETASAVGPAVVVPVPFIFAFANSLDGSSISADSFASFLREAHNYLIKLDSARRSALFRIIRFCLQGSAHVKLLVQEEIHWIIVLTLEKDPSVEYNVERVQSLKIIDQVRKIASEVFPVAFARSLVSIASSKDDSFRRLCLDSLRELALVNPAIVGTVGGFGVLLDAIIDPISPDNAEKILHTILFLLNDPVTRKILTPCVDLKVLLSPFSDLDTEEKEILPRWSAAKNAFQSMMKTWIGVVSLTADDMALPFLIKMLKDPKIPHETHSVILDCIHDVLAPIFSVKRKVATVPRNYDSELRHDISRSKESSTVDLIDGNRDKRANSDSDIKSDGISNGREKSLAKEKLLTNSGSSSSLTNLVSVPSNNSMSRERTSHRSSFSFTDPFFSIGVKPSHSSSNIPSQQGDLALRQTSNTGSSNNLSTQTSTPQNKHFSISSLFTRNHHGNGGSPVIPFRRASAAAAFVKSSMPTTVRPDSGRSEKKSSNTAIVFAQKSEFLSNASEGKPVTPIPQDSEMENDTIYNLMDNYTALICCSFLHVDLIESLILLGVEGERSIAERCRKILMNFLTIVSNVLPENLCADLLTSPALLELAASLGPRKSPTRTYKASLILLEVANTFSIMPTNHNSSLSDSVPVAITTPQSVRQRTGSNVRGSIYVATTSIPKSNFPSLNIQNIYLLAEEVKACSEITSASTNGISHDLISTISDALTPVIDKNEFNRQIDQTKVKEGKEPFKWDWILISQMLEHSFTQSDRLSEALKTKWVRRISGFFRCSPEEKGYFANMEWEPNNLQYLEVACNLYSVLMSDETGLQFLTQDRRGMIFNEIAHELELLTNHASNKAQFFSLYSSLASNSSSNSAAPRMVFSMHSCSYSMAREFFTLLGRILRHNKSRRLLDHANVFQHLIGLGQHHSLDYISRLVITSLSLTDGGIISRNLYQFWTADEINGACSSLLKEYLYNLLRVLIRCHNFHDNEMYLWCVETIISQLAIDDESTHNIQHNDSLMILYKGMMEALHSKTCAQLIISKRPRFILNHYQQLLQSHANITSSNVVDPSSSHFPSDLHCSADVSCNNSKELILESILIRLLAFGEGIQFLSEKSYLENIIQSWVGEKCKQYVELVEDRMNNAILHIHHQKSHTLQNTAADVLSVIQPIPIKIPDVAISHSYSTESEAKLYRQRDFNPNQSLSCDFHGLLRIPWNIEAKIVNHSLAMSDIVNNSGDYVRMDAFLDLSEVNSPLAYEVTYNKNRYMKVRGIVLDSKGLPGGKAIGSNAAVLATLLAGTSPILKNGSIQNIPEPSTVRKRTSTNAREVNNPASTSSRASFAGSMTPNVTYEMFQDNDVPITLGQEQSYEWFTCRASHRQGSNLFELGEGRFAVAIANEPVLFIFSRKAPLSTSAATQRTKSRSVSTSDIWFDANRGNRVDSSRSGGMLYLIEIHYFLSIETGQAIFVPMPRHLFGELTRTVDGCAELTKRNIIFEMIGKAHSLYDQLQKPTSTPAPTPLASSSQQSQQNSIPTILQQHATRTLELRSLLWSLGHIASNDIGLALLLGVDPHFIEWCVDSVGNCAYFSIRGTFFHVLGLVSQSLNGAKRLNRLGWDHADSAYNSAVAIPKITKALFGGNSALNPSSHAAHDFSNSTLGMRKATQALSRLSAPQGPVMPFMNNLLVPPTVKGLIPYPRGSLTLEQEVLNTIVKMPGVILYRECKSRLDYIRRENSEVFSKRTLFVEVMKILEVYNFKLTARRDILSLFPDSAKLKQRQAVAGDALLDRQRSLEQ